MNKALLLLLMVVIPVVRGLAAESGESRQEPVKIAVIFSFSGIAAPHNKPLMPMVQLAVEEINRRGGVLGRPVQLVVLDNESTPLGSKKAAEEAVRLDVTAVVGAHWSSHSLAMAPVLQQAGIPMITPGSTNPEVTRAGDAIFRICFIDSFQGMAMARFSRAELGANTAAIIRNIDEAYSVTLANYFSASFTRLGGSIVFDGGYRGKATDFGKIIQAVLATDPEVIYLPGYTRDSGLFIRQARKMGVTAAFLGGDAWDEIEQFAGDSLDGSFQSAAWHPSVPIAESDVLQKLYRLKYKEPVLNTSAPLAYDALMLLADAIERSGSLDRGAIRLALSRTTGFKGATGTITFDAHGDPKDKEVIIIHFQNARKAFHKIIKP